MHPDRMDWLAEATLPAACPRHWAISVQPKWNVERLNPAHYFGGRSLAPRSLSLPGLACLMGGRPSGGER